RAQNQRRQLEHGDALNFGIAVHYGEVVVGNLSSDSCIDYTVIGPNVNMVARLEELTKYHQVSGVIGANGAIVSAEAAASLVRHKDAPLRTLGLAALGVAVRSFSQIQSVRALTAEDALALRNDA